MIEVVYGIYILERDEIGVFFLLYIFVFVFFVVCDGFLLKIVNVRLSSLCYFFKMKFNLV